MKNMKILGKRALTLLMVLSLCLGTMQITAFADESEGPDSEGPMDSVGSYVDGVVESVASNAAKDDSNSSYDYDEAVGEAFDGTPSAADTVNDAIERAVKEDVDSKQADFEASIDNLDKETDYFENIGDKLDSAVSDANAEMDAIDGKISEAQQTVNDADSDIDSADKAVDDVFNGVDAVEGVQDTVKDVVIEAEGVRSDAQDAASKAEGYLKEAQAAADDPDADTEELQKNVDGLKEEIGQLKEDVQASKENVESAKKEYQDALERVNELQKKLDSLLEDYEAGIQRAGEKKESVEKLVAELTAELGKAENDLESAYTALKIAEDDQEEADEHLQNAQQYLKEVQDILAHLTGSEDGTRAAEKKAELEAELREKIDKLQELAADEAEKLRRLNEARKVLNGEDPLTSEELEALAKEIEELELQQTERKDRDDYEAAQAAHDRIEAIRDIVIDTKQINYDLDDDVKYRNAVADLARANAVIDAVKKDLTDIFNNENIKKDKDKKVDVDKALDSLMGLSVANNPGMRETYVAQVKKALNQGGIPEQDSNEYNELVSSIVSSLMAGNNGDRLDDIVKEADKIINSPNNKYQGAHDRMEIIRKALAYDVDEWIAWTSSGESSASIIAGMLKEAKEAAEGIDLDALLEAANAAKSKWEESKGALEEKEYDPSGDTLQQIMKALEEARKTKEDNDFVNKNYPGAKEDYELAKRLRDAAVQDMMPGKEDQDLMILIEAALKAAMEYSDPYDPASGLLTEDNEMLSKAQEILEGKLREFERAREAAEDAKKRYEDALERVGELRDKLKALEAKDPEHNSKDLQEQIDAVKDQLSSAEKNLQDMEDWWTKAEKDLGIADEWLAAATGFLDLIGEFSRGDGDDTDDTTGSTGGSNGGSTGGSTGGSNGALGSGVNTGSTASNSTDNNTNSTTNSTTSNTTDNTINNPAAATPNEAAPVAAVAGGETAPAAAAVGEAGTMMTIAGGKAPLAAAVAGEAGTLMTIAGGEVPLAAASTGDADGETVMDIADGEVPLAGISGVEESTNGNISLLWLLILIPVAGLAIWLVLKKRNAAE